MSELTEEQKRIYNEFRTRADPNNIHSQKVLERILRLSKFDLERAIKVSSEFDKVWKDLEGVPEEQVLQELGENKLIFGGKDNLGRRIIHFHYKLHFPKQFTIQCTLKLMLLMMDVALDDVEVQNNGIVVICWMEGSGWNNFDLASERAFTEIIHSFEPLSSNMLSKMILVDSPWYVWVAMKLMKPFLTDELSKKIETVSSKDLRTMFSADQLKENNILRDSLVSNKSPKWV